MNTVRSSPVPYIITGGIVGGFLGGAVGAVLSDPSRRKTIFTMLEKLDNETLQLMPYLKKRLYTYEQTLEGELKKTGRKLLEE